MCSDWPVMLEVYNHKLLTLIPDMLTTQTPCGSIINKLKRFCLQYLVSMVSQLYMIVFITFFKHEQYQLSLHTMKAWNVALSEEEFLFPKTKNSEISVYMIWWRRTENLYCNVLGVTLLVFISLEKKVIQTKMI